MGLDIYLYQYSNRTETERKEKLHEEYSEKLWSEVGEYNLLTQEQKDEVREKIKTYGLELGLDEWGSDIKDKTQIEEDSAKYPEHLFKVGYFRSSYNGGGINRVMGNLGIGDLYDIFDKTNDEYIFQPNWENALSRVEDAILSFKRKGSYRIQTVMGNIFRESEINSEQTALDAFLKEKSGKNEMGSYSNATGEFYFEEPLKVLAMIPGKSNVFGERDCVYVVTESDNSWYIQALEIIKETIEYVLSKENKEQYYLHWSG